MRNVLNLLLILSLFIPLVAFPDELPRQAVPDTSLNQPDQNIIQLIEIFHNRKFVIKTVHGDWYEGYVRLTPYGIQVLKTQYSNLNNRTVKVLAELDWKLIEEIRLGKLKRNRFRTSTAIGLATSLSFWLFLLFGLSAD